MSTTFGNAPTNPPGLSSTRTSSRSSTTSKTSTHTTPTSFTSPQTTNNSPFHLPSIIAIVLPIVIVLAIVSILFRWWRRRAVARSLATMMQAPAPKIPVQDEGYSLQPQLSAMPSYNQFGGQPQSMPMAVHPAPHPHNFYGGNHSGTWGGVPSPSQAQTPSQHYGQWQNHQLPGGNPTPLIQDDSPRPQPRPSEAGITYDQLIEESRRRVVPAPLQSHPNVNAQSWNSGGWATPSSPAPRVRPPSTSTPSDSGQHDHGAVTYPPRVSMPDQVHTPPLPHSETQPKGTVLLAWTPSIEPIASPSTAGFAHPAPPQQPGPSSSTTLPSQSSNGPGLHVLRERVQRLEAALVEHPQPREDDTPDRPPPAYDSRPGSPASGPTQGVDSTRTGGRTS